MSRPQVDEVDYSQCLIAAPKVFSGVEAWKIHPLVTTQVAPDASARLLQRVSPDSEALWAEVESLIKRQVGVRVVEGTVTLPCDLRLYEKAQNGLTKRERLRAMIRTAKARAFAPRRVGFESWYSELDHLKLLRRCQ